MQGHSKSPVFFVFDDDLFPLEQEVIFTEQHGRALGWHFVTLVEKCAFAGNVPYADHLLSQGPEHEDVVDDHDAQEEDDHIDSDEQLELEEAADDYPVQHNMAIADAPDEATDISMLEDYASIYTEQARIS